MKFKAFVSEYESIKPEDKEIVIHFRFATHGEISPEQTHPFIVKNKYGVMHNGIIRFDQQEKYDWSDIREESLEEFEDNYIEVEGEKEDTDSDTLRFCKEVLEELPDNFTKQAGIVTLLDLFLADQNSVLVIMDNEGNVTKHGCDDGEEVDGCWYSNIHWQKTLVSAFQTMGESYEQNQENQENY
jgi:predicted glutamine amidotransferase